MLLLLFPAVFAVAVLPIHGRMEAGEGLGGEAVGGNHACLEARHLPLTHPLIWQAETHRWALKTCHHVGETDLRLIKEEQTVYVKIVDITSRYSIYVIKLSF